MIDVGISLVMRPSLGKHGLVMVIIDGYFPVVNVFFPRLCRHRAQRYRPSGFQIDHNPYVIHLPFSNHQLTIYIGNSLPPHYDVKAVARAPLRVSHIDMRVDISVRRE